jgi:hypothetical protein
MRERTDDGQIDPSVGQACLHFLARADLGDMREHAAVGLREQRVAAFKNSAGIEIVQTQARARQALRSLGYLLGRRLLKRPGDRLEPGALTGQTSQQGVAQALRLALESLVLGTDATGGPAQACGRCIEPLCGGVQSAAAVGVGARRSAQKSAMVKSVSCPTPQIRGAGLRTIVRASDSSLKAHKSSSDPPPRTSKMTSISPASARA